MAKTDYTFDSSWRHHFGSGTADILRDLQILSTEPTQLGDYLVRLLLAQGIPKIMRYKVFHKCPKEKKVCFINVCNSLRAAIAVGLLKFAHRQIRMFPL